MNRHIETTLERLRAAADAVRSGFPQTRWTRVQGPGPDTLLMNPQGSFRELVLEPGRDLILRCDLRLPTHVAGVELPGDALDATLSSLYPIELKWNDRAVFADDGVPVACGPALIRVIQTLRAGSNGTLEMHVRVPRNQTANWLILNLTTPRLRARFECLDVAWAQLAMASELAADPREIAIVEAAAAFVPRDFNLSQEELSSALGRIGGVLGSLAQKAAALRVHLVGHSHIDMNWLWTGSDTVEVVKRDIASVAALMDEFPELVFSHSQPVTYEIVRREAPELFEKVRGHIKSGRWEALTMAWIEGDTNMASGEAHARQLLEGVSYSREMLGVEPTSYHAPDTFGHAGNLPQLAVSAGAKRYYHHRGNPGEENPWPVYWWEGDDGTRVLAFSTPSYGGDILARDLATTAIRAHRFGQKAGLHFHGLGDHGGGPARHNLQALRRFQKVAGLPTAFCSRLDTYTAEIIGDVGTLPTRRGESNTIFEGCYTTHADAKRHNRHGENLLCTADTLAAMAGQMHTDVLQQAWRTVLFNQFHDILDGAAIHEAYEQNAEDFALVVRTAGQVTNAALDVLEYGVAAGRVAVTNPLGWDREDWVVVPNKQVEQAVWLVAEDGHRTPGQATPHGLGFVARVPAYSTVGYRIEPATQQSLPAALEAVPAYAPADNGMTILFVDRPAEEPYLRMETSMFRAYVRRDSGILVSFVDKRVNRELVSYGLRRGSDYLDSARSDLGLNVFQLIDEYPHPMSAWHYHEPHTEFSLLGGATTRVIETGPARLVLEVMHTVRSSRIVQHICFYRDLARVDFETQVDWREVGSRKAGIPNLKVAYTARMSDCEAWFETPFAAARRPSDGQEVPALRWADVGGPNYGFAILNDSKYGYDALGCRLRLTLLRSAYEPDAISDVGQHSMRYSFVPHPGNWRDAGIVRQGQEFNQPLLVREKSQAVMPRTARTFLPRLAGGANVIPGCLKMSRDGRGRIVRLYENAGRFAEVALQALPSQARAWETNIVEDRLSELQVRNGSIPLVFSPWQVRTILVEYSDH